MNTSILDAILFDNYNYTEAHLVDLEEMPEHWVNPLYSESSYDEMSEEERKEAVAEITDYIEANTTSLESVEADLDFTEQVYEAKVKGQKGMNSYSEMMKQILNTVSDNLGDIEDIAVLANEAYARQ